MHKGLGRSGNSATPRLQFPLVMENVTFYYSRSLPSQTARTTQWGFAVREALITLLTGHTPCTLLRGGTRTTGYINHHILPRGFFSLSTRWLGIPQACSHPQSYHTTSLYAGHAY